MLATCTLVLVGGWREQTENSSYTKLPKTSFVDFFIFYFQQLHNFLKRHCCSLSKVYFLMQTIHNPEDLNLGLTVLYNVVNFVVYIYYYHNTGMLLKQDFHCSRCNMQLDIIHKVMGSTSFTVTKHIQRSPAWMTYCFLSRQSEQNNAGEIRLSWLRLMFPQETTGMFMCFIFQGF